jgi:hypothetical protein
LAGLGHNALDIVEYPSRYLFVEERVMHDDLLERARQDSGLTQEEVAPPGLYVAPDPVGLRARSQVTNVGDYSTVARGHRPRSRSRA